MNEKPYSFLRLIKQCAKDTELPEEHVRAALVGALGLFEKHAGKAEVAAFYAAVPGAQTVAKSYDARPRPAGIFGGMLKNAGGLSGAAIADGMGLLSRMSKLGVPRSKLRRLLASARGRVETASGRDLLGDVLRSVPGIAPLLGEG